MRLDIFLVKNKYYPTRNRAQNAIFNNLIKVNDQFITKTGYQVNQDDIIVKIPSNEYVSRGAYKLIAAIQKWQIDFNNKVVLDIGSSTGGFTEVAINNCAKIVYAVDVGSNQLHKKLLNDKRVKSLENLHFKDLHLDMFTTKIDLVLADLSFISLTKLINKLVKLLPYAYQAIFLIKPEFELSPKEVIKGKVKNEKLHDKAIQKIKDYAIKNNYLVKGIIPSPIKGNKLGNSEFLIYLDKK